MKEEMYEGNLCILRDEFQFCGTVTKRKKRTPEPFRACRACDLAAILHVSTYHIAPQEITKERLPMKVHAERSFSSFLFFFLLERGKKRTLTKRTGKT